MRHPFFSIVISTFQRRESVSAAVSALAQIRYTGKFEVVVVVDGSTDGTAEALAALQCPFPLRIAAQEIVDLQPRGTGARRRRRGYSAVRRR